MNRRPLLHYSITPLLHDSMTPSSLRFFGRCDTIPQDDLVAECRMAVKAVRQAAALEMALNPNVASVANEIRKRTHAVLRNKLGHEGR